MKWTIHQLAKYRRSQMEIDEEVQLPELMTRNPEIRHVSPVHVKARCTVGATSLTCHFQLEGHLILPSSRTWEDVKFPFSIDSTEMFDWSEHAEESENVHLVEGDVIHADPVLEELILLTIPLQVFEDDADERKPEGGSFWSFATEEELEEKEADEQKTDPRLAELAKYFDQTDD